MSKMSKTRPNKSRAQILAKRQQPIVEIPVQKKVLAPNGQTLYVPQPTHSQRLRAAFDASKYMPHIGAKEQERAKRCYMVSAFVGAQPRSDSIMNQMSKPQYAEPAYYPANAEQWNEYDSVF